MLYYDRIDASEEIDFNKAAKPSVWYLSLSVFCK